MKKLRGLFISVLIIGNGLYKAMVFMFLYNWFVSTTFELPLIGYWLSFAIILTADILTMSGTHKSLTHYEYTKINDKEKLVLEIGNNVGLFLASSIALFIGWLIQLNIY